jgi:hypothetical protein
MARVVGDGVFSRRELNQQHRIPRQLCDAMGDLPRLRLVDSVTSRVDKFQKLAFATLWRQRHCRGVRDAGGQYRSSLIASS